MYTFDSLLCFVDFQQLTRSILPKFPAQLIIIDGASCETRLIERLIS